MKRIILFTTILLVLWACKTQRGVIKFTETKHDLTAQSDSIEYELETFDSRFESWYMMQKSPSQFRSQSYYETWNRQYVSEWNFKATTGRNSFFEPIIGYEPSVDYGFELNHKLFMYFMYVERVLKIQILPNGPNIVIF
jgi:hypothetical protein